MYSVYINNILTGPHCPINIPDDDVNTVELKPYKKNKGKYKGVSKFKSVVRLSVLERDEYKCTKCGSGEYLEVHHKIHREHGGNDDMNNLRTICDLCHAEEHKGEPIYKLMIKACKDRRK